MSTHSGDANRPPSFRELDWRDLVLRSLGKKSNEPEPAYEFSLGRKFQDPTDGGDVYNPDED